MYEKKKITVKKIRLMWEKEVRRKKSIFHKKSNVERRVKELVGNRKCSLMIKIINSIKYSVNNKGTFYYTQRELAKYFSTSLTAIQYSMKRIQEITGIKFLHMKTRYLSHSYPKRFRFIAVPGPKKAISVIFKSCDTNSQPCDTNSPVDVTLIGNSKTFNLVGKTNSYEGVKNGTNIHIKDTSCKPTNGDENVLKNQRTFSSLSFCEKPPQNDVSENHFFLLKQNISEEKCMSKIVHKKPIRLKLKKKLVSYGDYCLHPKRFSNMVAHHSFLSKAFDFVLAKNVFPFVEETKEIMDYWNSVKNDKFAKNRINPESRTFREICLAVTYRMASLSLTTNQVKNAIANFNEFTNIHGQLSKAKKYHLLQTFLFNPQYSKKWFEICIKEKDSALSEVYTVKTEFGKTKDIVINNYIRIFHNGSKKKAEADVAANYKALVSFAEEIAVDHRDKLSIKVYGFNLTEYIEEYFDFIASNYISTLRTPALSFLFGAKVKQHFFRHMRNQGYSDFGYPKSA